MRSVPAFPLPMGPLGDGDSGQDASPTPRLQRFHSIQGAARTMIASPLHRALAPSPRQLAVLRMTGLNSLRELDRAQLYVIAAGLIMARVRGNEVQSAGELIDSLADATGEFDATLPATVLLPYTCAVAEQRISAGRPNTAIEHSSAAIALARESGDPRWERRALGLHAAAVALSGSPIHAEEMLEEIEQLQDRMGWSEDFPDYMAAVAGLLISFMRMDEERVTELLSAMRVDAPGRVKPAALMLLMAAIERLLRGEPHRALYLAAQITTGAEGAIGATLVKSAAYALQGMILCGRGEPLHALALLDGAQSPEGHFMCLNSIRASAFLALGQHHQVLEATSECVKRRTEHNLWTLPGALIRRAIAHLHLGHEDVAFHDATDAIMLFSSLYPSSALYLIPRDDLDALRAFITRRSPDLVPELLWVEQSMASVAPAQAPTVVLPAFTRREERVAKYLNTSLTYPEIATELHVATSTIKSQALAVFKKLGAHTREEAVLLLEQSGFYEA